MLDDETAEEARAGGEVSEGDELGGGIFVADDAVFGDLADVSVVAIDFRPIVRVAKVTAALDDAAEVTRVLLVAEEEGVAPEFNGCETG